MRFYSILFFSIIMAASVCSKPLPVPVYSQNIDVEALYNEKLNGIKKSGKHILLVFGADWCGDCKALDAFLKKDDVRDIWQPGFEIVKVDVGQYDHNLEFAAKFGSPYKGGIPALAVVDKDEKTLNVTLAGEFASTSRESPERLKKYLQKFR